MTAGVFDSGLGGLTVVKSLLGSHIFEEIIYFGDTARVPYGTKDKNTIIRYALEGLEFFRNFPIDIFIVACNTASAYGLPELEQQAECDVIGVIEPGVQALESKQIPTSEPILILGTKATVASGEYQKRLHERGYEKIQAKATGLFVPIVEEGLFEGPVLDAAISHYFDDLDDPAAVILGCTHFPLITPSIQSHFPQAAIVHSGEAIVENLKSRYPDTGHFPETKLQLFASDNPEFLHHVAKQWLQ